MNSCASRPHHFIGFLMLIAIAVPGTAVAQQTPSAADGPWSGQEQCALSTRAPDYQDDQIQTWRITGGPPVIAGSVRNWPGVWSVHGSGSRANPPEHWTVDVPSHGSRPTSRRSRSSAISKVLRSGLSPRTALTRHKWRSERSSQSVVANSSRRLRSWSPFPRSSILRDRPRPTGALSSPTARLSAPGGLSRTLRRSPRSDFRLLR